MAGRFDRFVILAGMRTGSNLLEESLAACDGITTYGEAFNPVFVGKAKAQDLLGVTMQDREADPDTLLKRMRQDAPGLWGFRFFADHDPRVLDRVLADPACAKIVLRRAYPDAYVSLKIARKTGQWRLGDLKNRKTAKVDFDAAEYADFVAEQDRFYGHIRRTLQVAGQAPFHISYEEISQPDVLNGLIRFLGLSETLKGPSDRTKKQNPAPLKDKITNWDDARAVFDSGPARDAGASLEPSRNAGVPTYVAGAEMGLLFAPVAGGPTDQVTHWLEAAGKGLRRDFKRNTLNEWLKETPGHRVFTIVRHPVPRLFAAYLAHIHPDAPAPFDRIRTRLANHYGVGDTPLDSAKDLRADFVNFARFIKGNLDGQTGIRVDASWASQTELLRGISQVVLPDVIIRETDMAADLPQLASALGGKKASVTGDDDLAGQLAEIYDDQVEKVVHSAYRRDYAMFGFGAWTG